LMMSVKRVWHTVVPILAFFVAAPTNAQNINPDDQAKARAMYDEAAGLMAQEKYAEACPMFEEVTKLIPRGVGARLALARCYEKLGQSAKAWGQYGLAETTAAEAGRAKEAQEARDAAASIRANLILVTVVVSEDARQVPGLSMTWDGTNLENSTWSKPIPVEVGTHVIEANAPLHRSWSHEISFSKGGSTHEIKVPVLEPVRLERENKPAVKSTPKLKQLVIPKVPETPIAKSNRAWMRPVGIGALGLGVAGFAVGSVYGAKAFSKYDESVSGGYCASNGDCTQRGVDLRNDMSASAQVSTWSFVAGGVAVGVGAILLIAAPRSAKESTQRPNVSWHVDLVPGGASVRGNW
jgi:hypothetical protein